MVNFDKFEKRVKETYGKQEFPFDEQNWEKAAKMIDASRQGKNRGGIFLLSAVALLCTTGLVYYFGFSNSTDALKKNNLASNDLTANKELVVKAVNNTETPIENGAGQKNNGTVNSNSTSENINNDQTTANTSSSLNGTSHNNGSVTLSKVKDQTKNVSESAAQNSTPETKTEEKTNTKPVSNTSESKSNESKANNNTKKPEQPKSNNGKAIPPVLGSNNNSNNKGNEALTDPVSNTDGNGEKLGNTNTTNKDQPTKSGNDIDSINNVVALAANPSESLVTDSFPFVKTKHADSLKFPAAVGGGGISYATNVKMEHDHKNFLFMEAGTSYLLGWNGNGHTDAGGFNLVAGLNFQHYFTTNFSAQIGAQYNSIGNMTQTSHTISTVNYDLGIEKDITSIKYQKLHYVVAPIKIAYTIKKNNIIGIGCNVAYLLNSDSKKEKYKTYSSDPNAIKNNLTSSNESGYLQGFNPIDVQVSAFYRRKIYKGLSVNAEFIYGLTDTKNNTFFKSNTFERTTGFKLTLCYDLFKK